MDKPSDHFETISAGETASVENVTANALSVSLQGSHGSHIELELLPGQIIGVGAGNDEIRILLHEGDPADLLVIKPENAS
jgi:hypothetical protein